MFAKTLLTFSFVLSASAIKVTSPSNTTSWTTSGSQIIKWSSVNTDPSSFTIQLYSPASPNNAQTLATTIHTDSDSYTYTPSSSLSAGMEYRINLIAENGGILAQSDYFEVKSGRSTASAGSKTASTSTPTSMASPSSGGDTSTPNAAQASASASPSTTGGADKLVVPAGMLAVVVGAIALFA